MNSEQFNFPLTKGPKMAEHFQTIFIPTTHDVSRNTSQQCCCMRYQQRTLNSKTRWETQHFVCSFPGKLQVVVPPGMMTGQVALAHTYPAQVGFCQFFSWVRGSEMRANLFAYHTHLWHGGYLLVFWGINVWTGIYVLPMSPQKNHQKESIG